MDNKIQQNNSATVSSGATPQNDNKVALNDAINDINTQVEVKLNNNESITDINIFIINNVLNCYIKQGIDVMTIEVNDVLKKEAADTICKLLNEWQNKYIKKSIDNFNEDKNKIENQKEVFDMYKISVGRTITIDNILSLLKDKGEMAKIMTQGAEVGLSNITVNYDLRQIHTWRGVSKLMSDNNKAISISQTHLVNNRVLSDQSKDMQSELYKTAILKNFFELTIPIEELQEQLTNTSKELQKQMTDFVNTFDDKQLNAFSVAIDGLYENMEKANELEAAGIFNEKALDWAAGAFTASLYAFGALFVLNPTLWSLVVGAIISTTVGTYIGRVLMNSGDIEHSQKNATKTFFDEILKIDPNGITCNKVAELTTLVTNQQQVISQNTNGNEQQAISQNTNSNKQIKNIIKKIKRLDTNSPKKIANRIKEAQCRGQELGKI